MDVQADLGAQLLERLTADQRRRIYEEERQRIEDRARRDKTRLLVMLIASYAVGCLLIRFGVFESLLGLYQRRRWTYNPEPEILRTLVEAVIALARPSLAAVCCFWVIVLPLCIPLALWSWFGDLVGFLKGGGKHRQEKR